MIPIRVTSRRDAVRGNDLVGGTAGDFGHAVELPRKAAGAGGGGAQFHDQVADLGFRHGGADAVPARPVVAGVEAQDLAAPRRQDGVDFRRRLCRTDDLHNMDRLQQHRLALRQCFAHAGPRRRTEREIGGIDAVVGAVRQSDVDVDDGEAERPARETVDHALFDRADIVARYRPPTTFSWNSKPAPRGTGLISSTTSPNWPWPPDCFLCRPRWVIDLRIVSR